MAIKGSLKEAGLADVCQLLAMGQKTGCLSVTDRSRFGQIYFDRGRITFATIVNRRDRLGDLLVREGVITHDQLMEAVDAQEREPDRRLGELLLERGFLDTETLTSAIQRQIEDAIYYLFTWKRGSFYFEVGRTPEAGEIVIRVNPETLLLEGARRVDEWSVIEKKIPSLDLIFQVDRERLDGTGVDLTTEQRALVEHMDGERTVEDLVEATGLSEFDVGKALYGLLQAGFATRVGRRDTDQIIAPDDLHEARNLGTAFFRTGMLEDADREFRKVLQAEPHNAVARHYLALIALRHDDAGEGVRRLSALLEDGGPRSGVYLNLALALRLDGRYLDALRVLAEARKLDASDPRVPLAEAAALLFSGDAQAAAARLEEYRELEDRGTPPAHYFYCAALCTAVTGNEDRAGALLEEGLEAYPTSPPLLLLAAALAERQEEVGRAEELYRRATEEDVGLAQAHRALGDLAAARGAGAEALEHYRRASEANPRLGDELYTRMGSIHYRRSEREEAIRCWRTALELNPDNEVARNHLEVLARAAG
ncbi:MAG TPA: DUF4388 domain-containing protein [Longimicrobiales bacterium]|nr:DUF4388 domain-containing protein [Longimicrobiales bacterium]